MGVDPSLWNSSGWIDDLEYHRARTGRDQFDIGSRNEHSDFATGLAAAHGGADSRNYTVQNAFTFVDGDAARTRSRTGFNYNNVEVHPQRIGAE